MHVSTVSESEFTLMRDYIEHQCGIALGEGKAYLIETRLVKLMIENGCEDFEEFYHLAKAQTDNTLRNQIIEAVKAGAANYVCKPFTREELTTKMLQSLETRLTT